MECNISQYSDSEGIIRKKYSRPYTKIYYDIFEAINDCEAFAIYFYLFSKPEGWKVRVKDIQNKLGLGEKKVKAKLKILRELGLYEAIPTKDQAGKICSWDYVISDDLTRRADSAPLEKPEGQISTRVVNPPMWNSAPHSNNYINTNNEDINNLLSEEVVDKLGEEKQLFENLPEAVDLQSDMSVEAEQARIKQFFTGYSDDEKFWAMKQQFMAADLRDRDEFLEDCMIHIKNSMKNGFSEAGSIKGLCTLIRTGKFKKPNRMKPKKEPLGEIVYEPSKDDMSGKLKAGYSNYCASLKRDQEVLGLRKGEQTMSFKDWCNMQGHVAPKIDQEPKRKYTPETHAVNYENLNKIQSILNGCFQNLK